MKAGDILWTWFDAMGAPCRPRQLVADLTSWGALALYSGQELALMPERAEGRTAATEAEALECWRVATAKWGKEKLDEVAAAMREAGCWSAPLALSDVTDALNRRIDSLAALLAQAEADNKAWAERCRWIPVGEKMPEERQRFEACELGIEWNRFIGYCQDGRFYVGSTLRTATHWRPLDPGPEAAEQDRDALPFNVHELLWWIHAVKPSLVVDRDNLLSRIPTEVHPPPLARGQVGRVEIIHAMAWIASDVRFLYMKEWAGAYLSELRAALVLKVAAGPMGGNGWTPVLLDEAIAQCDEVGKGRLRAALAAMGPDAT